MEETKKAIRIDGYDFFGYLVPGFVLLVAIGAAHAQMALKYVPNINAKLSYDLGMNYYPMLISVTVGVAILSYILGHAIATLASFFYERMIVRHVFGYPYERLFFGVIQKENSQKYKAIAVAIYLYLTGIVLMQGYLYDIVKYSDSQWKWFAAFVAIFIALIGISFTSAGIAFAFIFTWLEKSLLSFVGKGKPFPEVMRTIIEKKFVKDFGISMKDADTEVFWATYWKVMGGHDYVRGKIEKWLVLYSFMRNVGTSLLLSSYVICMANIFGNGVFILSVHSFILLTMSVLVIARYYYLYYSYYTKSVFRAYAFIETA